MRISWLVAIILITLPAYALAQNSQTPRGAEGQAASTPSAGKPDVIAVGPKVSDGSITIVSKDKRIGLIAVITVPPSTMAKQRYRDETPGPHLLPSFVPSLKDSQFCIVRALIQIPCKRLVLRTLELGFQANGKATPIACEYSTPSGEVRPIDQMPGVWSGAKAYPVVLIMDRQYAYGTKLAETPDELSRFEKACAAEGPQSGFPFDLVYELPTSTKVAELRFSWTKDQQDATGKTTNKDVTKIGKVTVTAERAPIMQGKETVLTATKGEAFDVSEVKGEWYGVLPSRGWIHKANVRFEPATRDGSAINAEGSQVAAPALSAQLVPEVREPGGWRVVSAFGQALVPDRNGEAALTLVPEGVPPPLQITVEIDGTYADLLKFDIARDFKFYDIVNNREVHPFQVVAPQEIPASYVGDRSKKLVFQVYLADFVDAGSFGRTFRGGYRPEWIGVTQKGGKIVPLTTLVPGSTQPPPTLSLPPGPLPGDASDALDTALVSKAKVMAWAVAEALSGHKPGAIIDNMSVGGGKGVGDKEERFEIIIDGQSFEVMCNWDWKVDIVRNATVCPPPAVGVRVSALKPMTLKGILVPAGTVLVRQSGGWAVGTKADQRGVTLPKDSAPVAPATSGGAKGSSGSRGSSVGPEAAFVKKASDLLPPFTDELQGQNPVRVRNPNDFAVTAGIRSGNKGKNLDVPANGVQTVYIPDGKYEVYFVYSNKPDALFQGDDFTLSDHGVEIQIVKVVGGNYGIRQVK